VPPLGVKSNIPSCCGFGRAQGFGARRSPPRVQALCVCGVLCCASFFFGLLHPPLLVGCCFVFAFVVEYYVVSALADTRTHISCLGLHACRLRQAFVTRHLPLVDAVLHPPLLVGCCFVFAFVDRILCCVCHIHISYGHTFPVPSFDRGGLPRLA